MPPWRRLLAMVNWRPVYDIEQRTNQLKIESLESEKRAKLLGVTPILWTVIRASLW